MSFPAESVQIRRDLCRVCPTPCDEFRAGLIDHADPCAGCSIGRWKARGRCLQMSRPNPAPAPVETHAAPSSFLPVLWGQLHRRALGWSTGQDVEWLTTFTARLPCGDCRRHWQALIKSTPPRWSDYFAWSVEVHNAVNVRIGKPAVTLDQAACIWSARPVQDSGNVRVGA